MKRRYVTLKWPLIEHLLRGLIQFICVCVDITMVRNYVKISRRVSSLEIIRKAVDHYFSTKDGTKKTASLFGIPRSTLRDYVKRMNKIRDPQDRCSQNIYVGYTKHRQVFSVFQEQKLVKYIQHASRIYFGLSPTEVRV